MAEQYKNPITGEWVDEVIKQKEAEDRGFFTLEFLLRHLEDENEFVKVFVVGNKKIVVDMARPHLQYRKPLLMNHERVLQNQAVQEAPKAQEMGNVVVLPISGVCNLDDETCMSCSG